MRFTPVLTMTLLAMAPTFARAEPISATGYTAGCGEEGCFVSADGYLLFASTANTAPEIIADMTTMPLLSAIAFDGDLSNLGDATGDLAMTAVSRIEDDLYEGNLQAMQGDWTPVGEETPFIVSVSGMIWQEIVQGEAAGAYAIAVGEACADGVVPGGMAISLYEQGGDPDADACWQVEYVDESSMVLRDFFGEQGQVEWVRP